MFSSRPAAWSIPAEWKGQVAQHRPKMTDKVIALTFDDGPVPGTTEQILDALHKEEVVATFFVTGNNAKRNPALLLRMIADGHVIANHTWNHPANSSMAEGMKQVHDTQSVIQMATLRKPNLFRPPYGIKTSAATKVAKQNGMAIVLWTLTSADTGTKKWEDVYTNIVVGAKPGDIALMHDVKPHTAKALPLILRDLKKKGFRFVTANEMLRLWSAAKVSE